MYNQVFPTRASDCAGRLPLIAHPALLQPRRPYHPAAELSLFDLQRVVDFLATFTFERTVTRMGQVRLGDQAHSIGRRYARAHVHVQCDPATREWCFRQTTDDGEVEIARRALKHLDILTLTGLL